MNKVSVEINSQINEIYSKSIVTQKFLNTSEDPLELKIYIPKKKEILFSSFNAKIGESTIVKSKVIKKEKAEEKYTDAISSGNAAIYVSEDLYDENKIIINMGNIPAKQEVILTSEYLQYTESWKSYKFELFRDLPIFKGKSLGLQNNDLTGKLEIRSKYKIINIEKEILMENLEIIEEKYQNEEQNSYLILYKINDLPKFNDSYKYNLDYIPCSRIYFEIDKDEPIIYTQKSIFDNKYNYVIQYKNIMKENFQNSELNPALFIFLFDQSVSMEGIPIKIVAESLKLFLYSLPLNSYYQLIGFCSKFIKYDETPKEINEENIKNSIKIIEKLSADLGGTDIYSPLKDIYNSSEIYDKLNLPKKIFLLTDGEIYDLNKTLKLIENNNSKFSVFSIGINGCDINLIKNAGIIGKGNYHFCCDLNDLDSIIGKQIYEITCPYISNLNIKTSLDNKNLIKNDIIPNVLKKNWSN